MGQKDLSQKELLLCPDVFADLVNGLLYKGNMILRQEELHPAPTETIYRAGRKKLKNQIQDVGMDEIRDGRIYIRYTIENQTQIDRRLVFRKAGYQGICYRKQYDHTSENLYPVVGIVLYWGKKTWKKPHNLKDFFSTEVQEAQYMDDVRLNLYEMANLSAEIRKRFKSDIRVITDYLAEGESYIPSRQKLKHPEEVLIMLSALTGDVRFEDIIEEVRDKEDIRMCELIDRYEKRGRELGSAIEIVSFGEELEWSVDDIIDRLKNRLHIKEAKAREYYETYRSRV